MESGEKKDFYVWTNRNGDYVLDKIFEEDSDHPWVCNDLKVPPFMYNIDADDMLFSLCPVYGIGTSSFGLMAPDSTGLGYVSFAGDTDGHKYGSFFIDNESAYDGIYCDSAQAGGTSNNWEENENTPGTYFIGHDSIKGTIVYKTNRM